VCWRSAQQVLGEKNSTAKEEIAYANRVSNRCTCNRLITQGGSHAFLENKLAISALTRYSLRETDDEVVHIYKHDIAEVMDMNREFTIPSCGN
jgi:hypothetical protein